ncbi:MAG: Zeta toxin family protein [Candidatus Kapabacteria bacterium]|nr:Zeta toxin family protein [Candidatus Kapabacteria bacterium]
MAQSQWCMETPYIIIIAGPNGVGKSTFAAGLISTYPACAAFVNADVIARDLETPSGVERNVKAGRIVLETIDALVAQRASFMLETTLSGTTLAERLEAYRRMGYRVILHFFYISSIHLLHERVALRVRQGGHDVPLEDQQRRHLRS